MLAYLSMMAPRLVELHRVLKETSSLYLHCDPTASHYLKLLLEAVFGPENVRNEIVWKRSDALCTSAICVGSSSERRRKSEYWLSWTNIRSKCALKQRAQASMRAPGASILKFRS
jgi:hypothetical protein